MKAVTTAGEKRLLTAEEFEQMGARGILHEDARVELLDGELYQMAALGSRHVAGVLRLTRRFSDGVRERAIVSVQNAIRLSEHSEPQPDIALLRPRDDYYESALPRAQDVLLLIEVADSSLGYDRDTKLPLYAAAGIAEVWIVDGEHRRVTVYRAPGPDGYTQVTRLPRRGALAPLAFPDLTLHWHDSLARHRSTGRRLRRMMWIGSWHKASPASWWTLRGAQDEDLLIIRFCSGRSWCSVTTSSPAHNSTSAGDHAS